MQAGALGVGASRAAQGPREVVITGTEFRNMQKLAAQKQLNPDPIAPGVMGLGEAFERLAAGQIDLEDPSSPIRYATPTEIGHAVSKNDNLRHYTLLTLDDGERSVVFTIGEPRFGGGDSVIEEEEHSSHRFAETGYEQGGEIHVELERRQPEVIYHNGPPPEGYDQLPPEADMQHGRGYDDREPAPMPRERDFDDLDREPMPRGRRGEPMQERREPTLDRQARGMPQDDTFDRGGSELRVRPEDGPQARKVGGSKKRPAEEPAAGEDKPMKVGRVSLTAADHKELHEIAEQTGIPLKTVYASLRAPTNDERLYLRSEQPLMQSGDVKKSWFGKIFGNTKEHLLQRDAEAQERLITIDPKDGCNPILVSLAQKPSYVNLITGALHFLSAAPGLGGKIQFVGGALLATAGAIASFLPFVKREHNVDMVRGGLKHMALGAVAVPTDYGTLGYSWYARAPLALAMGVQDFAQFFRSRKSTEAAWLEVKGKPNAWNRATGVLDTVGSGVMSAIGR